MGEQVGLGVHSQVHALVFHELLVVEGILVVWVERWRLEMFFFLLLDQLDVGDYL